MAKLRRVSVWLWLLTKRLYKKPTFLVILALIPALVLGYGMVAREDSGVMTIALAAQDNSDPLAQSIIADLMESKLIYYRHCDTPDEAMQLLQTGKADAAWIFSEDLEAGICKFITSFFKRSVVKVVERESNVAMMLSREKLSGTVFAHCSPYIYLDYIRSELPQLDGVSDEQLMQYYNEVQVSGRLFEFSLMDGSDASELLENSSYLTSPVRGLLAVVVVLCGLAGAMYAMQDEKRGTFGWIRHSAKPLAELAGEIVCVANAAIAMVIALVLSGVTEHWFRETVALLLFILAVSAFSMLVSRLCGSLRFLGMWTPILLVVMLVVCPVLFDLGDLFELQLLFPPTYYINAVYSDQYMLWMPIYTAVCFVFCFVIDKLRKTV